MTVEQFSRNPWTVVVIGVVMTLTACGSSTTTTGTPSSAPVPVATANPTAASTAVAPVAPSVQNDQPSADIPCGLITEADATAALGFDPGRSHIDTSQVFNFTDKACAWGEPKSFNPTPVVDISAKEYKSANAAQAAFNKFRAHAHTMFTDPGMAQDAAIGYGAVIFPTAGAASSTVCSKQWVVTILFNRNDRAAKQAKDIVTELSRAVVSNLP